MEEHLSPAFYMIPAIDNTEENVIYINRAHMNDDLTLFTTLAHEGYPGHLYQTVYYENTDPDPIRSVMDFGGYVEGWATYAEMGSYYLTPLSKEQAVLLQKNSSIILGFMLWRTWESTMRGGAGWIQLHFSVITASRMQRRLNVSMSLSSDRREII